MTKLMDRLMMLQLKASGLEQQDADFLQVLLTRSYVVGVLPNEQAWFIDKVERVKVEEWYTTSPQEFHAQVVPAFQSVSQPNATFQLICQTKLRPISVCPSNQQDRLN